MKKYAVEVSHYPEWDSVGDHWPRELVYPLKYKGGREALAKAKEMADFGQPVPINTLVLKHKGRRGWIVSRIIPGYVWDFSLI